MQCYICGVDVEDSYAHFNDIYHGGQGICALWDGGLEKMHDGEVKIAADAAIKALIEGDPTLTEEDLRVKFSAEAQSGQAGAAANAAAELVAANRVAAVLPQW